MAFVTAVLPVIGAVGKHAAGFKSLPAPATSLSRPSPTAVIVTGQLCGISLLAESTEMHTPLTKIASHHRARRVITELARVKEISVLPWTSQHYIAVRPYWFVLVPQRIHRFAASPRITHAVTKAAISLIVPRSLWSTRGTHIEAFRLAQRQSETIRYRMGSVPVEIANSENRRWHQQVRWFGCVPLAPGRNLHQ